MATITVLPFFLALSFAALAQSEHREVRRVTQPVPNEYVVVLRPETRANAERVTTDLVANHQGTLIHRYEKAILGFSAILSPDQAAALADHPSVEWVEENARGQLSGRESQSSPPWHLDRIDDAAPVLDGTYDYCNGYEDEVVVYAGRMTSSSTSMGRHAHGATTACQQMATTS